MAAVTDPVLREFEPLSRICSAVPHKSQRGLLTKNIEWTCVDVTKEYVAIGTNTNLVYVFDRKTSHLQKLNVKLKGTTITAVKLMNSVDYEVAVGTSLGVLFVFTLPSILPGKNKQLKMFKVDGNMLHPSAISCLEWSQNAMKIFSGDVDGVVVCTEIDYEKAKHYSYVVCKEPHDIIQLHYSYRTLIVSTRFRSIIPGSSIEDSVTQIGLKDRKLLGAFGAVAMPGAVRSPDADIYVSRPGLRLWKATAEGAVSQTYIFKDLVCGKSYGISMLADTVMGLVPHSLEDCQFGPLRVYQESYLVSYHGTELYVIDPAAGRLRSFHTNTGYILDVAVCGDEIFVLRRVTGRVLLRLAYSQEDCAMIEVPSSLPLKKGLTTGPSRVPDTTMDDTSPVQVISDTASRMSQSFLGAIKGVGEKIKSVQDGKKSASKTSPPWGTVSDDNLANSKIQVDTDAWDLQRESSVDSAREMSPTYIPSPTEVSSSETMSPECETLQGIKNTSIDSSKPASSGKDPPPIVKLDGDQLTVITVERKNPTNSNISDQHYNKGSVQSREDPPEITTKREEQLPSVADQNHKNSTEVLCPAGDSSGMKKSPISSGDRSSRVEAVGREEYEELVYYRKPKKHKKKKPKSEKEMDTGSVGSTSLNSSPNIGDSVNMYGTTPPVGTTNIQKSSPDSSNLMTPSGDDSTTHSPASSDAADNTELHAGKGSLNISIDIERLKSEDIVNVEELLTKSLMKRDSLKGTDDNVFEESSLDEKRSHIKTEQTENCTCDMEKEASSSNKDGYHGADLNTMDVNSGRTVPVLTQGVTPLPLDSGIPSLPADTTPLKLELNDQSTDNSFPVNQSRNIEETNYPQSSETQIMSSCSRSKEPTSDSEDFYSMYKSESFDGGSLGSPWADKSPLAFNLDIESAIKHSTEQQEPSTALKATPSKLPLADSWMETSVPTNIQFMSLTDLHIWITDKHGRVFYSSLGGPTLKWTEMPVSAKQMAVSPSGWIVWRLYKNMLYVGTNVGGTHPMGREWRELARDVAYLAVDDKSAWYIKLSGEVGMHKGLSRARPHYRYINVPCDHQVSHIACRQGVVWALTTERFIIVRTGVKAGKEEGLNWEYLQGDGPCQLVSCFALGDRQTAWFMDLVGRVWFTTGVTTQKPGGDGHWWQVSMSEYLMEDSKASRVLRSLMEAPHNLTKLMLSDKDGIISAGRCGVWLCPGRKNILHICRGSILGHRWQACILTGMLPSTRWLHVSAAAATNDEGLVWAQQSSGSFFCFPLAYKNKRVVEVSPPVTGEVTYAISATQDAFWVLQVGGDVYIRRGMGAHCPQGVNWVRLNLTQLGSCKFVHLSCGTENVWAVDNTGLVYMRIGIQAPVSAHLSPAWVPVDGCPKDPSAKFIKVYIGPDDRMVWALDNKMCVYVRRGVTDNLPLGKYWSYVSGTQALGLTVSNKMVYALNPSGEILVRYGISSENIDGDYWKKIPGAFSFISATADDELWAIDKDDLLYKRYLNYLQRSNPDDVLPSPEAGTEDGWELL